MVDTQIIILNWNNAADTIACINSVIGLDDARIVVFDNNSTDNSADIIYQALQTSAQKPVLVSVQEFEGMKAIPHNFIIARSDENLGFAKAVNVILRKIANDTSIKYTWLLNNDAIADANALNALKKTIDQDRQTAFAGSVILDYYNHDIVQCTGVQYFKYFGVSKLILKNESWANYNKGRLPLDKIEFQHGASLLIKTSAIPDIGLMDENFFLYFEEHDWQFRAEKKGYKNALATESYIYHKGSMSTNSKRHLFFFYYNQSAIYFSRKNYVILVCLSATMLLTGITLIRTKMNLKSLLWGIKGIITGWSKHIS